MLRAPREFCVEIVPEYQYKKSQKDEGGKENSHIDTYAHKARQENFQAKESQEKEVEQAQEFDKERVAKGQETSVFPVSEGVECAFIHTENLEKPEASKEEILLL